MRIVIVGAGIGGLATALSLHTAGFRDVTILERSTEIRGLGVGINLLPHAMRELTELDLADEIAAIGVAPTSLTYGNRHGQTIWTEPRGLAAGYRWPQMSVHRGRLQLLLLDAVRERLGDVVRLGRTVTGIEGHETSPVVRMPDDALGADLVIAADGIHSAVRRHFYPDEGPPPWSGLTLWRGVARIPSYLDGHSMVMLGDGDQKFVAYPLGAPDPDGRILVNFIAERRGVASPDADWNRAVERGPLVELFAEWRFDWIDVPATIATADEVLEYPMVDRDALPTWTFGRVTLLGDAAHAMYPNGSNGASQAILDARTLAFHLSSQDDATFALAQYEAARRPATTTLLEMTRQTGPERVMQLAYERSPGGFDDIHDVIPAAELQEIAASYKRAAGFDPAILNERPSLNPKVAS